ncbi:hypothetical protein C453_12131 [Haloferax elongans ATCC BAA-1513]|uniref:DUF7260 domain-containing protein n=1 Tax=Haloferax elongans ATCC BAA-1513 TaxID=1230453 RepID=M0HLS9_HALEO|nr:hypothetical protein [Haloferax elongans]ELZ84763.1 hypothetical protein C453_12131 [Haloferax elongans ATCC BAA-1513]
MNVERHTRQALDRVHSERERILEKQAAYDEFERRIRGLSPGTPNQRAAMSQTTGASGLAGCAVSQASTNRSRGDQCQRVREAFAQTVRPCSLDDVRTQESLLKTIREELGEDLAIALAPESASRFTPETKRAVLEATAERCGELTVMERALEREERSLEQTDDAVTDAVDWLSRVDETPLSTLGFDELQTRHAELSERRTRCDTLARERQSTLAETSNSGVSVAIQQRALTEYLYAESAVEHPALATIVSLDSVLAACQRGVRDHLVRRV